MIYNLVQYFILVSFIVISFYYKLLVFVKHTFYSFFMESRVKLEIIDVFGDGFKENFELAMRKVKGVCDSDLTFSR